MESDRSTLCEVLYCYTGIKQKLEKERDKQREHGVPRLAPDMRNAIDAMLVKLDWYIQDALSKPAIARATGMLEERHLMRNLR